MKIFSISTVLTSMFAVSGAMADYQIIEVHASSSASLNATGCCSMSYMGSTNPSSLSMRNCQSVYMSCVGSKRAAVWQFDLTQIPDDATLISARFKGTRPYSDMQGSGFLSMAFDTGPLNSSVCMSLWNGGDWQTSLNWPYGTDFSLTITSGLNLQFDEASTMSLLGYAGTTSQVTVVNSGNERPVLELTIDVPDAAPCDGDINDDQVVNGSDISMILGYWGQSDPAYDVDGSGMIDGADLAIVLGEWGQCPE
ncbi:MAG: dockerin type I domain-containing protein [Phycisphaerales bacterium]|nr:dockerin type I domain-containing protein [Phycisphaerales bacterium]